MPDTVLRLILMKFPRRLAALRKERQLTQQAMADQIGIHVSQLKRYETGATLPTLEVFQKITLALNVSADTLLFDPDDRGPGSDALRLHFEAVSRLDPDEQNTIMDVIDGMLLKHDAKRRLVRAGS